MNKPETFKIVKYKGNYEKELTHAERKLEEAKKELDDIRDRKKHVHDLKEKIRREQAELDRLDRD